MAPSSPVDGSAESVELLMVIDPDLALRRLTCCEPLVSTHPDTQGYGKITWRSDGHSRTMSAHRFALLLAYGEDSVCAIGEHRCNEPLCVRVDQEHVIVSTQRANLRYAVSLGRAGAHRAPTDGRTRVERSLAVRAALAGGWDPIAYAQAAGETLPSPTPRLF